MRLDRHYQKEFCPCGASILAVCQKEKLKSNIGSFQAGKDLHLEMFDYLTFDKKLPISIQWINK